MQAKVLVFIVSYFAAKHIASVLERIPPEFRSSKNIHILCIDDCSSDDSAETAQQWVLSHNWTNVTILRNPVNQGYGGNQKLGYRLAIEGGYDLVILLHGDGQYAPELLPRFIEIYEDTKADVILGSRMHSIRSAMHGGMPLYKVVGNRILTVVQNAIAGGSLSEYHTGYRAYSTTLLSKIPFEINTNDFHFDTEAILQAYHCQSKVVEFPIPTHYGDEVCRVNGLKYARDVILSTVQYFLHSLGMFCSLKYQNIQKPGNAEHMYSAQARALQLIRGMNGKSVIQIGLQPSYVSVRNRAHIGTGASPEFDFHELDSAGARAERDVLTYDFALMLDVLERLDNPETFLLELRNSTAADIRHQCRFIVSAVNVAFITLRFGLLLGRFNYAERGILNVNNKRLFTKQSFVRLLEDCGYTLEEIIPIGAPFELVMNGPLGRLLSRFSNFLARCWPELFAFQFLAVATPKPGVSQLLAESQKYLVSDPALMPTLRVSGNDASVSALFRSAIANS